MTLHLLVSDQLVALADRAAEVLATPPADPFARDLVAVPGDGVRTWLVRRLAERLGASTSAAADGIATNIEFVFPGALVRRAIGRTEIDSPWSIGPLTWALHDLLHEHGHRLGLPADAVRARAIADLFDRYSLHRVPMVSAWERGADVDAAGDQLASSLLWQPQLWRLLVERWGVPSDAARIADDIAALRSGRLEPAVPQRVLLFGLASLPAPHLEVLTALATRRDVHLLAPVPSSAWWQRLAGPASSLATGSWLRSADPSTEVVAHRLARTWARAPREAHLLLRAAAQRSGASIESVSASAPALDDQTPLLARLQAAIRADLDPPGAPAEGGADLRPRLAAHDHSVQWHRCHGLTRQVEVLRDVLLRLLDAPAPQGGAPLEPRDIAILCADVAAVAPIAEAVFGGDGPGGAVLALPLRVADRSLRTDIPLLDAVVALFGFTDGRFRAGDVLSFAARPPVSRRFGFTAERLGRIVEWVDAVHIRWGLDAAQRTQYGLPAHYTAATWQAGLDQLLVGAAMADAGPRLGPGHTVPFGDVEGDDLDLAGDLADYVHRLGIAAETLSVEQSVAEWCEALRAAALQLCALDDADSWHWQRLETELTQLAADATAGGVPSHRSVPPEQMAMLLAERLAGRSGRPRFGSGAITLSSLTAQRGVPHRVVCLVGLDADAGGSAAAADDLTATSPVVGDRDARSETRAQLLDALLAAGDHLVICSNGRDLRTNVEVPPTVALAEFADLIDASVVPPLDGPRAEATRASDAIALEHPRQAWSERNFQAGALGVDGPWGFDSVACQAALQRRQQTAVPGFLPEPLPVAAADDLTTGSLYTALTAPVRQFLSRRLGMGLDDDAAEPDDLVPLAADSLDVWKLADALLAVRLGLDSDEAEVVDAAVEQWAEVERAGGALPPFTFGDHALNRARTRADLVAVARNTVLDAEGVPHVPTTQLVDITLPDGRRLHGEVSGVHGHVVVAASVSRLAPKHRIAAWLHLAVLGAAYPDQPWQALVVGTAGTSDKPAVATERWQLLSAEHAAEALACIVHLADCAGIDIVPAFPATTEALHRGDRKAATAAWGDGGMYSRGERDDRWVQFVFGDIDLDDLLALAPRPDETGDDWGSRGSRVERWADRVWGTFARTVSAVVEPGEAEGADEFDGVSEVDDD
jgi:exodeoxyribonuclease V gamma subunit